MCIVCVAPATTMAHIWGLGVWVHISVSVRGVHVVSLILETAAPHQVSLPHLAIGKQDRTHAIGVLPRGLDHYVICTPEEIMLLR